ncbi:uncharacterized protein LOC116618133 isoform X2 [Nematostella vectensis]|uniref:uncharacterized protein LOC116618133 isoform X2 n=1 Tax=Nematostella vectensis TaxID=45351 RepID=UPI0020777EE1|nr:uncharacterized protein LOC116618133 isoform X2 [Nematostella vectensis]
MLVSWLMKVRLGRSKRLEMKMALFKDSFYEEITEKEWKELHRSSQKTNSKMRGKDHVTARNRDMFFVQTDILSPIPECFDLEMPRVPHGPSNDSPQISPRDETALSPKARHSYIRQPVSTQDLVKQAMADSRNRKPVAGDRREQRAPDSPLPRHKDLGLLERLRHRKDGHHSNVDKNGNAYMYEKTRSKIKMKTKIKRRKERSGNAATDIGMQMDHVSSIETSISFASYVKRRNPNFYQFRSKEKNKLAAGMENGHCGFLGYGEVLHAASDNNVTFNPIFDEEESRDRQRHSRGMAQNTRDSLRDSKHHLRDSKDHSRDLRHASCGSATVKGDQSNQSRDSIVHSRDHSTVTPRDHLNPEPRCHVNSTFEEEVEIGDEYCVDEFGVHYRTIVSFKHKGLYTIEEEPEES